MVGGGSDNVTSPSPNPDWARGARMEFRFEERVVQKGDGGRQTSGTVVPLANRNAVNQPVLNIVQTIVHGRICDPVISRWVKQYGCFHRQRQPRRQEIPRFETAWTDETEWWLSPFSGCFCRLNFPRPAQTRAAGVPLSNTTTHIPKGELAAQRSSVLTCPRFRAQLAMGLRAQFHITSRRSPGAVALKSLES